MLSRRFLYQVCKRLFPRWVKNALENSVMELERFHPPRILDRPPGNRVLVLAPHPDDETIGCGGTLRKYVDAGARVHVAILTDGRQGDPEIRGLRENDKARHRKEEELVERRKRESLAALDILGVEEREFLGARDGELHASTAVIAPQIARVLSQWRPDVVLLPFVTDRHADHFATNSCFVNAIEQINATWTGALQCAAYEIWSPIYANVYVDITTTIDVKRKALACYQSQIGKLDYAAGVEGLNRFRAASGMVGGDYAEAFFVAPLQFYRQLYRSLLL